MILEKQNIDKTRSFLLDGIRHSKLVNEKHKKVHKALNHFVFLQLFLVQSLQVYVNYQEKGENAR